MPTFNISIAEPCHQPWNTMQPIGCGAFCSSCQKEVIDFTEKTQVEIAQIIGSASTSICGRFTKRQLVQEYEYIPDKLIYPGWFRRGLVGTGLTLLVLASQTKANIVPPIQPIENVRTIGEIPISEEPVDSTKELIIEGVVLDESNTPLPFAIVTYFGKDTVGTVTDLDGKFKLKVAPEILINPNVIRIFTRLAGFLGDNLMLTPAQAQTPLVIHLKEIELGMVGLIIVKPTPLIKTPQTPIEHELWYDYKFNGGE